MVALVAALRHGTAIKTLMSFVVFVVGSNPILSEGFLRGSDIELASADHLAHEML
jgi:hypothetical protein